MGTVGGEGEGDISCSAYHIKLRPHLGSIFYTVILAASNISLAKKSKAGSIDY